MTAEHLRSRLACEPAERLTPFSAGAADQAIQRERAGADVLSNANWQAGTAARPVTHTAARPNRALDGA